MCRNVLFSNIFFCCVSSLFQSPLVQAIFSRNAEEVTFLLNHNEDVNSLVILSHVNSALMLFFCCGVKFAIIIWVKMKLLQMVKLYISAVLVVAFLVTAQLFFTCKVKLAYVFGYCQFAKHVFWTHLMQNVWCLFDKKKENVFLFSLRTKYKAHPFMLLLIWVMSTLWTYLLLQVEKTFFSLWNTS